MSANEIKELIDFFGSRSNLARVLGVRPPAVSRWKKYLPKGRAYEIEVMTNGKFKAKDLIYESGEQKNG